MALAVLVVFEDDEAALSMVEWLEEDKGGEKLPDVSTATAPAIYKFPTQYHNAYETHGMKKTSAGFTLGQKWGWWVCSVCRKPSDLYWESIVKKQSSFGKNIKSLFFTEEN